MTDLSSTYPPLLRMKQVAEVLNLHPKTVEKKLRAGEYGSVPEPATERPYRWRRNDLEQFIDNLRVGRQRHERLRRESPGDERLRRESPGRRKRA